MTKKLFILVNDREDGSYDTSCTMNEPWIQSMQDKYEHRELCYPSLGLDGDGFHYTVLTVPDECTLDSLGIFRDCAEIKF